MRRYGNIVLRLCIDEESKSDVIKSITDIILWDLFKKSRKGK